MSATLYFILHVLNYERVLWVSSRSFCACFQCVLYLVTSHSHLILTLTLLFSSSWLPHFARILIISYTYSMCGVSRSLEIPKILHINKILFLQNRYFAKIRMKRMNYEKVEYCMLYLPQTRIQSRLNKDIMNGEFIPIKPPWHILPITYRWVPVHNTIISTATVVHNKIDNFPFNECDASGINVVQSPKPFQEHIPYSMRTIMYVRVRKPISETRIPLPSLFMHQLRNEVEPIKRMRIKRAKYKDLCI